PNPCLRCNEKIKFEAVLRRGLALGFDAVATGHYALTRENDGVVRLFRSAEPAKDQSYVLGVLNQEQLAHSLFPLGPAASKAGVRAEAAALGLSVARKPDSNDICFIASGDTPGYLRAHLGEREGDILDEQGQVVGRHLGAAQFTVGQRRGLHLGRPAADGLPRYVIRTDVAANTVTVGPRASLAVAAMRGIKLTWTEAQVTAPWRGLAQWRAHSTPAPAEFSYPDGGLRVELDEPACGLAPGQQVVCYDGERVVGSAVISQTAGPGDRLAG
ncbi:MAG: tRNA 2-thiouridine(34) synthase MnmA, partial [Propionibacteriaceae bacterium]|nr:tRNA 2-thiouridine(34) synthase MnmA [Propionibacteriaceae bacterium]